MRKRGPGAYEQREHIADYKHRTPSLHCGRASCGVEECGGVWLISVRSCANIAGEANPFTRLQSPTASLPISTTDVCSTLSGVKTWSAFRIVSISCLLPVNRVQPGPAWNCLPHAWSRCGVSSTGSTLTEIRCIPCPVRSVPISCSLFCNSANVAPMSGQVVRQEVYTKLIATTFPLIRSRYQCTG